jgi:chorismate dehydratase
MLRAGRIVYTNDLPIYIAFDRGAVRFPGALVSDVPATLNAWLVAGRLDFSPVSSFAWAKNHEKLALLPDLCIGSRNEVWSVVCVSKEPLAKLDGVSIATTKESASGRNLLRVLLERRYGVKANFVEHDDPFTAAAHGTPAMLIGDRAIDAKLTFTPANVYDLGVEWHAWTGLDMVYAVWAARKDALSAHRAEIGEAMASMVASQRWSAEHPEVAIEAAQRAHARPEGFYESYYETLNFDFDDAAQRGLQRYVEELHAIGAIDSVPQVIPEVLGVHP